MQAFSYPADAVVKADLSASAAHALEANPSLSVATQLRVKRRKQPAPVFSLSALKQHQLKAVTCDMILRDLIPAVMLDGHPRLVPHRFEAHVKLCRLGWGRMSPAAK
jgi:hypothetical protein